MISSTQLDQLQKLHKDHIANTFLFTAKVLEQYKRISDAHTEAMHSMLRDMAAVAKLEGGDPAALAQNAMAQATRALTAQGARASTAASEMATAYAEILRLVVEYGNDSFTGTQDAGRTLGAAGSTLPDAWSAPWTSAFETMLKMMGDNIAALGGAGSGKNEASRGNRKG